MADPEKQEAKSVQGSLEIARGRFQDYRQEVLNAYSEKKQRIGEIVDYTETDPQKIETRPGETAKSQVGHEVAASLLEDPVEIIQKRFEFEWYEYTQTDQFKTDSEQVKINKLVAIRDKYQEEAENAVKIAKGYLKIMTQSSKHIDADTLAEMRYSAARDIKHFSEVLGSGEHKKLMDSYMWVLGLVDPTGAKAASMQELEKYLTDDSLAEVESCTWLIVSFMKPEDRKELMTRVKSKMTPPSKFHEKIVKMGIERGVISPREAQEFGLSLDPQEESRLKKIYTEARDFSDEALSYMRESYGATPIISKIFTGPYILRNGVKLLSLITAGVNLGVGAWGGGFAGFMAAITGSYALPAAGVYAGVKALESNVPYSDIVFGDATEKARAAKKSLALKMDGPHSNEIAMLFKNTDAPGLGNEFYHYVNYIKQHTKSETLPSLLMSKSAFADYLQKKYEDADPGSTAQTEAKAFVDAFKPIAESKLPDSEILELALITSTVVINDGGSGSFDANRFDALLDEGRQLA